MAETVGTWGEAGSRIERYVTSAKVVEQVRCHAWSVYQRGEVHARFSGTYMCMHACAYLYMHACTYMCVDVATGVGTHVHTCVMLFGLRGRDSASDGA
jgi:hypothetical protein